MRCFISAPLSEDILNYLFDVQNKLRKISKAKIRFVPKKQLHITLKFLGSIDGNKLKNIKNKLEEVKYDKFKLTLSKLGVFPNLNYARVLWVGVKEENIVIELQKRIDEILLGLFSKEQKFSAHITLGRIKNINDKEQFKKTLSNFKIEDKDSIIDRFELMESVLRRDGAVYNVLEIYKLKQ